MSTTNLKPSEDSGHLKKKTADTHDFEHGSEYHGICHHFRILKIILIYRCVAADGSGR